MSKSLTPEQAYRAMFQFLEEYYEATGADDVGALLGGLQLLSDGKPADEGVWREWHQAVERVLQRDEAGSQ